MMVTRLKRVPWLWVIITMMPWAFGIFVSIAFGTVVTLELRKFTNDPFVIATLGVSYGIVGYVLTPVMLYISDFIWTPWGRRKPLLALGFPAALAGLLIPYANNLVMLLILLVAWNVISALGPTFEPLTQEIIPPHQRGRASIVHSLVINFAILAFFAFMIGRFDDLYTCWPWSIFGGVTGEKLIFYTIALMNLANFLLVILGVKELPPAKRQTLRQAMGGTISLWQFIRRFFVDVFELKFLPIYFLTFSSALYGLGLGGLGILLYTDQWGYTKQEMGNNVAIGAVILIPFTFLTGFLADKYNKLRVYQACIIANIITCVVYYLLVMYGLPDHRPTLFQIFLFGEIGAAIGTLSGVVSYPLIYDYIPRDKMGTAAAGLALLRNFFGLALGSAMGAWISLYSGWFMPHAGIRAMVVFSHPMGDQQIVKVLDQAVRRHPSLSLVAPTKLFRSAWLAPGEYSKASNVWILRTADPVAQQASRTKNRAVLQQHDAAFREALEKALAGVLVPPAAAVSHCRWIADRTLRLSLVTTSAPAIFQVREMARELAAHSYLKDVIVQAPGGIVYDADIAHHPKELPFLSRLWTDLRDGILQRRAAALTRRASGPGLTLTAVFKTLPPPTSTFHPSAAVATRLAGAWPATAAHTSGKSGTYGLSAAKSHLAAAERLYEDALQISIGNRLPVAKAIVKCSYSPRVNDYFAGYLLTIFGGIAAVGITLGISWLERKGKIHRAGVEEEMATPEAQA